MLKRTKSLAFRIGGDEFVALLEGEDYLRREELLLSFDSEADRLSAAAEEPWEKVRVSAGMAVYDPATDENAESVFSRADSLMYENKKRREAVLQ